ncbi:MAG TPA: alpha/beta fold hydrolase [Rectinemataceae bacterium]|nr:alpha/beta fold hydrolase [Rectinemataceae bacterium]
MAAIPADKKRDKAMPCLRCVTFDSGGSRLQGFFFHWSGITPKPTLLLLHGIPGSEQNFDIARAIHRRGWNCLIFHYRGCWGSQGDYSIPGILDDIEAATSFLRAQEIVDTGKLAIAGISLGGWAAIAAASREPLFKCVVPIAPASGLKHDTSGLRIEDLREFARHLTGTTAERLRQELCALAPLVSYSSWLADRRILLITAGKDECFPEGLYDDFHKTLPQIEWLKIPRADHVFLVGRGRLVQNVVAWLVKSMG